MLGRAGMPAEPHPRLAGRYRLEERLSEQDGSSVYRATDETLARPVAVRTFAPGFGRIREVVAAARAASRLNDPRLAKIFDADDRPEHAYIVSEWPSGVRLDDQLATGPLGPLRAAAIVAEAADAVAAAHAAGLAHLCLTPDVVWWTATGDVMISGLGTAAALSGAKAADPLLADARGLARVLYAALTAYWPGKEKTALPAAPRSGGRVSSPRQVRAWIPPDIDAVTCRALFEEGGGTGPPIVTPAELAAALGAIVGPARRLVPAALTQPMRRTQDLTRPTVEVPVTRPLSRARTAVTASTPVTPVLPVLPAVKAQHGGSHPRAVVDQPAGTPRPEPPTGPPAGGPGGRRAARPAGRSPRQPKMHTVVLDAVVLLVLAVLGVGGWLVVRELTSPHSTATATGPPTSAARALAPASAMAFDPYGDGQGGNNQIAPLAIDRSAATNWHTEWYTTADFGDLKPGTGLLLDMSKTVTISAARITLGSSRGADFQLRAGSTATSLAALRTVARAESAAGVVNLRLSTPARARYLLIWFTRLPPGPAGTFQVSVYDVRLEGPSAAG